MGDEPFTTLHTTLRKSSAPSTNPRQAAYAGDRAKVLFGSYRRGDANDPDAYVASIAAVLSLYDMELIRDVTDPRTGIQTTEKHATFMPQAGELKRYCDGIAAHRANIARLGSLPSPNFRTARLAPPPDLPGRHATTFIAASHERYPAAVEWTKQAEDKFWKAGKGLAGENGVWVCYAEFVAGRKRSPHQQAAE
jgi:hypothetical protein